MKSSKSIPGKIRYAILFVLIIPGLLIYWAILTKDVIRYNVPMNSDIGLVMASVGAALISWGMFALYFYGNGLPMNAYPPKHYVKKGPYRLFKHPIYWGFGILAVGASLFFNSSSGLWLVSPITIMGMIALVWGYEQLSLLKRFPEEKSYILFKNTPFEKPSIKQRLYYLIRIVFFYFLANYIVFFLSGNTPAFFGSTWKIQSFIENFNFGVFSFIFMLLPVLLINKQTLLKKWANSLLIGIFLLVFISLLLPQIGAQYFLHNNSIQLDFDFLHKLCCAVPMAFILISLNAILKKNSVLNSIFIITALLLILNQLLHSNSSILHLLVSLGVYLIATNYIAIWEWLRIRSNSIANSWKEWVIGPVRIINHGFYVGFGSFFGIFISGWLVGPLYAWAILAFAISVIIFSALWAQLIEGSEKLKRPFGYYGALIGILFASLVVWLMGVNVWVIIGVISVVMPWVQAIGRLRCLVNGCCHGDKTSNEAIGIRYFHLRSRVCGVSNLKGELLHPTQLYAIIWLFFVGFILLKLWFSNFSYPFIFGIYLILTGLGRFVEEAYRGEVQTIVWKGLRLYQWTAILTVLIGMIMTTINVEPALIETQMSWEIFLSSILGGLITFFAMGVDFPNSNARFSRLV